jgi:hypothetical protein
MQHKKESSQRLKASFEREFNVQIPDHPVPSAATPPPVAPPPAPVPQLLALAQKITFQPATTSSLPKFTDRAYTSSTGPKNKSSQVPQYLHVHDIHHIGTAPIYKQTAPHSLTTNYTTMSSFKRLFPTGETYTSSLKRQRTSPLRCPQCPRTGTQTTKTTQQHTSGLRKTPRKFRANQHRTISGEYHAVRHAQKIHPRTPTAPGRGAWRPRSS